jgi:hypothetical protein
LLQVAVAKQPLIHKLLEEITVLVQMVVEEQVAF